MLKQIPLILLSAVLMPFGAAEMIGGGRAGGRGFEVFGGFGTVDRLQGRVNETIAGREFDGGIFFDLGELGVDEDPMALAFGASWRGKWVSLLLNYRYAQMSASGVANQDFRFRVNTIQFQGQSLDFLLLPEGSSYELETETTWLGGSLRVTPLTVNPDGVFSFTPWLHLGLQLIHFEYLVRAGGTGGIQLEGQTDRLFAVRGQGRSRETAAIPEYGIGGELRWVLTPQRERPLQLVAEGTYKMLDFQGSLGRLGFDADDFRDVDFTYASLELNLYAQIPLSRQMDLTAGIFVEQVDVDYKLQRGEERQDLRRDIDLSYNIYGIRIGLHF